MRLEAIQRRRAVIFAAGFAILGSSFAVTGPARAWDDNSSGNPLDSVLGFVGLQSDKEKENIDYRARPPLVVPPSPSLPQPVAAGAGRPATWPVDPDEAVRRRAAADSRRPAPQLNAGSGSMVNNGNGALSKTEMLAGRAGAPEADTRPANDCQAMAGTPSCLYTPLDDLKAKIGLANHDNDIVMVGEEPPRDYLTEPPAGYRKPTATTKAVAVKMKPVDEDPGDNRHYARDQAMHKTSVDDN